MNFVLGFIVLGLGLVRLLMFCREATDSSVEWKSRYRRFPARNGQLSNTFQTNGAEGGNKFRVFYLVQKLQAEEEAFRKVQTDLISIHCPKMNRMKINMT